MEETGEFPQSWGNTKELSESLTNSSASRRAYNLVRRRLPDALLGFRRHVVVNFEAVGGLPRLGIALCCHDGLTGIPSASKKIDVIRIDLVVKLARQKENPDTSMSTTRKIDKCQATLL